MKTRATITIDPEVLEKTRQLSRKNKTNVSRLIEELLTRELQSSSNLADGLIGKAVLRKKSEDPRYEHLVKKYIHS